MIATWYHIVYLGQLTELKRFKVLNFWTLNKVIVTKLGFPC